MGFAPWNAPVELSRTEWPDSEGFRLAIGPKWGKSGTFSDQISVLFVSLLKSDFKKVIDLSHFRPNWPILGPNMTSPDLDPICVIITTQTQSRYVLHPLMAPQSAKGGGINCICVVFYRSPLRQTKVHNKQRWQINKYSRFNCCNSHLIIHMTVMSISKVAPTKGLPDF